VQEVVSSNLTGPTSLTPSRTRRTVTVFNVCGNNFRLITAVHYDRQKVFILDFLTHAEYSRNLWKNRL
jgi:mRNA interferase HigB